MADRWAVGTGNWNNTTTVWSDSDGGAPGSFVPVNGDAVYMKSAAVVTVSAAAACTTLDCTGCTGGLVFSTYQLTVAGNVTLVSGMTVTGGTTGGITVSAAATILGGGLTTFTGTLTLGSGNKTLTASGTTWGNVTWSSSSTVTLGAALTISGTFYCWAIGTPVLAGAYDITCANFIAGGNQTFQFVSGTTLTVSTALYITPGTPGYTTLIRSTTASSPAYLTYSGAASGLKLAYVTFTDIEATNPVINWNGGTLTRTAGIYNATMDSFPAVADVESGVEYGGVDDASANRLTGTLAGGSGGGMRVVGGSVVR